MCVVRSIHYFRIPRYYWRDRLQRMKALGLNAIEVLILDAVFQQFHST